MRRAALALLPTLWAAMPAGAELPSARCLSAVEAEALASVALPDILRQTGALCAARLPAASVLRLPSSALLRRYDAEADRAWPAARAAIVKLSDPMVDNLLQSRYARPLLTSVVAPLIVGRIAVKDCATIDGLVTALAPLPPRNTAMAVVTALRYAREMRPPAGGTNAAASLPLCPLERR